MGEHMRKIPLAVLIAGLLAGCASTEYVENRVSATDDRIATLIKDLEDLKASSSSLGAAQSKRLDELQRQADALGKEQRPLADHIARVESHTAMQQGIMASLTSRLNQQEKQLAQVDAQGNRALQQSAQTSEAVSSLSQKVAGLERAQAGLHTGQQDQNADLQQIQAQTQQIGAKLEEAMAKLAQTETQEGQTREQAVLASARAEQAMHNAQTLGERMEKWAAARPEQTSTLASGTDEEARKLAKQALDQATTALEENAMLLAKLEVMSVSTGEASDPEARQLAQAARERAEEAMRMLTALYAKVDSFAVSQPGLQAAPSPDTTSSVALDERLARMEADAAQRGQRLEGVESGLDHFGATVREIRSQADGLTETDQRLDLRLKQSEELLVSLQGQVLSAKEQRDTLDTSLQQTTAMAREALERALAAGQLAQGKFVYEVVLSEDKYHFGLGSAELTPESVAALDDLVLRLNALNADVFLEIQGHTDTSGSPEANQSLAKRRALAVRDYLHLQGRVPLHRMSAIAMGASRPAAGNDTRAGRRQNRRVVIEVLR